MNYFSYFSEIEDTFIRRRGKHLMLSPIDWALIESWKERGVPLHVALRGIDHAFDSHDAKKQKRTVKTLLYCQEEVEAQYAEWLESRVGSQEEAAGEIEDEKHFSRATVLTHLNRSIEELTILRDSQTSASGFGTALSRAVNLLAAIKEEYESAARPDTRRLEESLSGIDRLLDDAIQHAIDDTTIDAFQAEVDEQVKPYKRHMEKAVLQQTRENLLRKRLREHFNVTRLSLFYL